MTTQPAIDFDAVSAPVDADTKAVVDLVATDWNADNDWRLFERECRLTAYHRDGRVDPNRVRKRLSNEYGLTIEPRRYSSFWSRAAGRDGFLVADGWVMNDDKRAGNRGKPTRAYRLRTAS